jgi:hypothetical protein
MCFLCKYVDVEHDCKQCEHVLEVLEEIDDNAEAAGVYILNFSLWQDHFKLQIYLHFSRTAELKLVREKRPAGTIPFDPCCDYVVVPYFGGFYDFVRLSVRSVCLSNPQVNPDRQVALPPIFCARTLFITRTTEKKMS